MQRSYDTEREEFHAAKSLLRNMWQTVWMPKRNLRVTKWLGMVPAVAVCTFCNREFTVPLSSLKKVTDAQESLRLQFAEHKCVFANVSEQESGP
jgi:hypothetical protein